MTLYPKELNSLKALELEKKKLRKQLEKLDEEELFSLPAIMGSRSKGKNSDTESEGFDIASLLSFLPISSPLVAPIVSLVQKRLFKKKAKKEVGRNFVSAEPYHEEVGHKVKRVAGTIALDVLTGYLKWKAIELTYKGVKHLIKTRKEKKEAAL